jgi:hypothetical protein
MTLTFFKSFEMGRWAPESSESADAADDCAPALRFGGRQHTDFAAEGQTGSLGLAGAKSAWTSRDRAFALLVPRPPF